MSIADNFKMRKAAPGTIAPADTRDVEKRIAAVEQQQSELRKRVLALDAELGRVAAAAPLSEQHRNLNKELQEAHEALHLLDQSFEGLKAEREAMFAQTRARSLAKQKHDCGIAIDQAVADATEVAAAVQAFVKAHQKLVIHARAAHRSVPFGVKADGLLAAGQLKLDIGAEIFRLAAEASGRAIGRDVVLLPVGAMSDDTHHDDNPAAIKTFVAKVTEQARAFKALLQEPTK